MKGKIALIVLAVVLVVGVVGAGVRYGPMAVSGLQAWNAARQADNSAKPVDPPANISIPQNTAMPPTVETTATLPPPLDADELYARGSFPGILYSAARGKITNVSPIAGEAYTTPSGNKVGDGDGGIGWNQPFARNRADWVKYLAYQTGFEVPPGQRLQFEINYATVILDPPGMNWQAPYSAFYNAVLLQNMVFPEFTGKHFAEGLALTAPNGVEITISYDGGATFCTAQSVQLVPDKWLPVSSTCPDGAVACKLEVGQYGHLYDLNGNLAPAEVQTLGGNNVVPGCVDPNFPGVYQWLQSFK